VQWTVIGDDAEAAVVAAVQRSTSPPAKGPSRVFDRQSVESRIDIVELGGVNERRHDGGAFAAAIGAGSAKKFPRLVA